MLRTCSHAPASESHAGSTGSAPVDGYRPGNRRDARCAGRGTEGEPRDRSAPLLPAPKDPSRCVSQRLVGDWWKKAEELADLEPKRGRGWHSLRRKFASDLMDQPLKVLCELGGWKTVETVLPCYQRADEEQLRKAPESRRVARS